jgi:hypothetical protein
MDSGLARARAPERRRGFSRWVQRSVTGGRRYSTGVARPVRLGRGRCVGIAAAEPVAGRGAVGLSGVMAFTGRSDCRGRCNDQGCGEYGENSLSHGRLLFLHSITEPLCFASCMPLEIATVWRCDNRRKRERTIHRGWTMEVCACLGNLGRARMIRSSAHEASRLQDQFLHAPVQQFGHVEHVLRRAGHRVDPAELL